MGIIEKYKPLISKKGFTQRIVICGSMSFYGEMLHIHKIFKNKGIHSIVPEPEDQYNKDLEKNFWDFKRRVSFQYLRKIRSPSTIAILAVNKDKHGIHDYIGPNTFAEIAVAFAQQKKIFLLQGIPKEYIEELSAWRVIPLNDYLYDIFNYYNSELENSLRQLDLFDDQSKD